MTADIDTSTIFISHAARDRAWAEWVAWQLAEDGYDVELDAWDWSVGDNFIERMRDAVQRAAIVVALYSEAYFESDRFTNSEWTSIFAIRDGSAPRFVPVRIENVAPPKYLRPIIYQDLFGLSDEQARRELLKAVAGPSRPGRSPGYPSDHGAYGPSSPRVPGSLPRVWNVPPRNVAFTGRDGLLLAVREQFRRDGASMQALHGIGGVGKTALAIEYAHRFAGSYHLIWWIDVERPGLIGEQLAALGVDAGWVDRGVSTAIAVKVVKQELRSRAGWLLVFDNAEGPDDLWEWLPEGPGHVIVTSRNPNWALAAIPSEITVFERPESVTLLQRVLPTLAGSEAGRVARALGDLPLAVAQAAGVLAETGMSVAEYLGFLKDQANLILSEGKPIAYPVPLAAAIRVSVRRLGDEDEAAAQLLRVCAFLAPEPVPVDLFTGLPAGALPQPLATVAGSKFALLRSVGRIGRYGLAKVSDGALQLHRLTQAGLAGLLDPSDRTAVRAQAEALLVAACPDNGEVPGYWPAWAQLLPHLLAADPASTDDPAFREVACHAASYLLARGDYRAGVRFAGDIFQRWRDRLGPDHPDPLTAANNLAASHWWLGQYATARLIDEETMLRRRRVLGEDHPDTLASASNLAGDLRALGRPAEARQLNTETLASRRRVLGEDHPDTLDSASNLAGDLRALGKVDEARQLAEETLASRSRVLGEDHPDSLRSASNLAGDLRALGEIDEARSLDEKTLASRSRVLGEDHPDTLISASNLADDLFELGDVARARRLDQDTLERRRRVLGDDHPDTLVSARNLVRDLGALGADNQRLHEVVRAAVADAKAGRPVDLGDITPFTTPGP